MFEIPEAIFGIPFLPLVGVIIGVAFAVNEAMRTKYRKVALKVEANGQTIVFDNRYIITAIVGVAVVFFTVAGIKDAGLLNPVPNNVTGLVVALTAGFTEGWAVIRTLNTRLDVFIKERTMKAGADEEQAEAIADAVQFVEIDESPKPEEKKTTSFEEL